MKKHVFLLAGLSAVSVFASDRDATSIGNRLGDGAFMKASGLSPVEWAALCSCSKARANSGESPRIYNYSETGQSLRPTETLFGTSQTLTVPSDGNVGAGTAKNANFSETTSDSVAAPIYPDSSNLSDAGAPANAERGAGSGNSVGVSATGVSDYEWASDIKAHLTRDASASTSGSAFTVESLRDVKIRRSNGMVMLTGSVPSESMKRQIETRVQELSGINSIDNQLRVAPSADVPASPNKDQGKRIEIN